MSMANQQNQRLAENRRYANSNQYYKDIARANPEYYDVAKILGITNIDSRNDIDQITAYLANSGGGGGGGGGGGIGPITQQQRDAARALGIKNIDSQNDLRQIEAYLGANRDTGQPQDIANAQQADQALMEERINTELQQQELLQGQLQQLLFGQAEAMQQAQQAMDAQMLQAQQASQAMMAQQGQMLSQALGQVGNAVGQALASAQQQQQEAANLARAYVPPPVETVGLAPFGDIRPSQDRSTSQLSELTTLTFQPGAAAANPSAMGGIGSLLLA